MGTPPLRWICPALLAPVLAACSAQPAALPAGAPALLVQTTPAVMQELRSTLAQMLGVPNVLVADDALSRDSLLVIEKVRPCGKDGLQLSGRDFDKPEQFRLLTTASGCVIVRLRTGSRQVLRGARCALL